MADDPRERIETNCLFVALIPDADTWDVDGGYVDWSELVELAQKILAADEAWKDSQTPTVDGLRTKYPGFNFGLERIPCGPTFCDVAWIDAHPFKVEGNHFESEIAALRWLAATLAEITPVEGREEVGDGK